MKIIKDLFYTSDNSENRTLDIYLPDCKSFPVFIYFHGGGPEAGDKSRWEKAGTELAESGICSVSANYRMYPEATYPQFIQDAASAVAWVKNNIGKYGNVKNIYAGGSSAGGYLSQMLCFDDKYLAVHKMTPTDIKGFVHDAGQPTAHFNVLREKGIDSRRVIIDETAPLYHICEKEYSNMIFIFSDNDMKNRYEQHFLLKGTLEHFNIPKEKYDFLLMRNSTHCSYCRKDTPDGKNLLGEIIKKFIERMEKK